MLRYRFIGIFPLVLGFVGISACIFGGYGVWGLASDARRANERLFVATDDGLDTVEAQLARVQKNVDGMRISGEEFQRKVKTLTQKQARERIAEELDLVQRADHVSGMINIADARLETALDSLGTLQKMLELCRTMGADVNTDKIHEVTAVVAGARGELEQVAGKVKEVRDFGRALEGESVENRIARVSRILARLLATIADLDSLFQRAIDRLETLRAETHAWQHRADIAIQRILAAALLVLVWIALGQWVLLRFGWRKCFGAGSAGG